MARLNTLAIFALVLGAGVCFVVSGQQVYNQANKYVIIIGYAVQLLLAVLIVATRLLTTRYALAEIPKDYVPILEYHVPARMHATIFQTLVHAMTVQRQVGPRVEHSQLFGWGQPGTDSEMVHFKTSVAISHLLIERAATERDPELERASQQSVREYVIWLGEQCDIDRDAVDTYVDMYERAVFSKDELSEAEYNVFLPALIKIMQSVKEPAL